MKEEEFKKYLKENATKIGINISEEEANKFLKYKELIIEWNEKINLTAILEDEEFVIKHLIDSLTINKYIKESDYIIDIGTGAGFPGIPIKILNSQNEIVLMDSLNKRLIVLNDIIKKLNLKNVKTLHGRAEELFQKDNFREKYDIATARAVAGLNTLVELMMPAVKIGGLCICMKGKTGEEELKESTKAIETLGGKVKNIEKIILPESDFERTIILIEKVKETPRQYPRKPGTPQSKPIK